MSQHISIADDSGIVVDYVGRFENLEADFRVVCERIGLPPLKLPHIRKSCHKDYRRYYDKKTIRTVAEVFKEDIRMFGYEFGK